VPTTKQRRQTARRRLQRQLERRREAARRRRQRNLIALLVAGVVVVVIGGVFTAAQFVGDDNKSTTQPAASASPTAAPSPLPSRMPDAKAKRAPKKTSGPCGYAETDQTLASPYTFDVGLPPDPTPTPDKGTVPVTLKTNVGNIVITLNRAEAPCAVQSFLYLADKGFFEHSACHRLVTQGIFVLQCGDPTATGSGGPTYQFKDEHLDTAAYGDAIVAMANSGPNTNGSQFFIIYKDSNGGLQKKYSVIGSVTSGIDVVQKVADAGENDANGPGDGRPKTDVIIQGVTRKR
jgi:peptidyl-prolyl cis-trans isomerase B (cyclophilin B)